MTKENYEQAVNNLSPRFTYLHGLGLCLDGLSCLVSQNIEPYWEFDDADKQEVLDYQTDIDQCLDLIRAGVRDFDCFVAKEAEPVVLSLDRVYRNAIQHTEVCQVEESSGLDVFCVAFYGAFLTRAGTLAADLIKLSSQAERAASLALDTTDIIIDLVKFNEGGSKELLIDLIDNPGGVLYDTRYGKKQPSGLTDALKSKVRENVPATHKYDDAAKAIGRKGNKIYVKKGFRLIRAK